MASCNNTYCSLCDQNHITTEAVEFCPDCDEYLCSECQKQHGMSKLFKAHSPIPVNEYTKLPPYVKSAKLFCDEHEERFDLYCPSHDQPCCMRCMLSSHKECTGVTMMNDVIKNAKTSTLMLDLEQSLSELIGLVGKMRQTLEKNKTELFTQKQSIIQEIGEMRRKIDQHFDMLERKVTDELSTILREKEETIDHNLGSISEKDNLISGLVSDVDSIKEHASDFQTFWGLKDIERLEVTEENSLTEIITNGQLDEIKIKFAATEILGNVLGTTSIGEVSVLRQSSNVNFLKQKEKQAQIGPTLKTVNDSSLRIRHVFVADQARSSSINGCTVLPDGCLLCTEYNPSSRRGRLLRLNTGKKSKQLILKVFPDCHSFYDIVVINSTTVAVMSDVASDGFVATGPAKIIIGKVFIIESNSGVVRNTIRVGDVGNYGITHFEGFIIACKPTRLCAYSVKTGSFERALVDMSFEKNSYITSFGDKLYVTQNSGTVSCLDFLGHWKWVFKDERLLSNPRGIAVDNEGNVYVAGENSENIVIIVPDGSNARQLLSKENGLSKPNAIHFNRKQNQLIVCNSQRHIFVVDKTWV